MNLIQLKFCNAVASHFGIPKAAVKDIGLRYFKETGAETPDIRLVLPDVYGITIHASISKNEIKLKDMFVFKRVEKSNLFSDMLNAFTNTPAEVVVFQSGGALIATRQASSYKGKGGILVKASSSEGYVFEPLNHYLDEMYPKSNYYDPSLL
jgi:hypothetical protein